MYQMNTGVSRAGLPTRGRVGHLRPGERESEPARVRRAREHAGHQGRAAELECGVPAHDLPGDAVPLARQPDPQPQATRRHGGRRPAAQLDLLARLNGEHLMPASRESPTSRRGSRHFELAYRMQMEATDLGGFRARKRPRPADSTGSRSPHRGRSARSACWPAGWWSGACGSCRSTATASGTPTATSPAITPAIVAATDMPIHGLLTDLKRRGLLDSTLVIWGGEFGRMPVSQGSNGRDHNPRGFLIWMAGAGIKGGVSHGDNRRDRLPRRDRPGHGARPARHDAASARPRSQAADVSA